MDLPDTGQCGITATADEYDAVRFPDALLLDRAPRARSADRLAACAVLLFGDRAEGHLVPPAPVSPLVALEVERLLAPATVRVPAVDFVARPVPPGGAVVVVEDGAGAAAWPPPGGVRRMHLRLPRSDRCAGSQVAMDGLTVASNAWLLAGRGPAAGLVPLLAVAVLFGEDLEASRVEVAVPGAEEAAALSRCAPLLAATGLGLDLPVRRPGG